MSGDCCVDCAVTQVHEASWLFTGRSSIERVVSWVAEYRGLLNRFRLWHHRAKFDIMRTRLCRARAALESTVAELLGSRAGGESKSGEGVLARPGPGGVPRPPGPMGRGLGAMGMRGLAGRGRGLAALGRGSAVGPSHPVAPQPSAEGGDGSGDSSSDGSGPAGPFTLNAVPSPQPQIAVKCGYCNESLELSSLVEKGAPLLSWLMKQKNKVRHPIHHSVLFRAIGHLICALLGAV